MSVQSQRKINRATRIVKESLDSHIDGILYPHKEIKHPTKEFHRQCIKEYTEVLKILQDLREYIIELEG